MYRFFEMYIVYACMSMSVLYNVQVVVLCGCLEHFTHIAYSLILSIAIHTGIIILYKHIWFLFIILIYTYYVWNYLEITIIHIDAIIIYNTYKHFLLLFKIFIYTYYFSNYLQSTFIYIHIDIIITYIINKQYLPWFIISKHSYHLMNYFTATIKILKTSCVQNCTFLLKSMSAIISIIYYFFCNQLKSLLSGCFFSFNG